MSTNKPNIQQIQQYLRGELDAKAMHQLEREAQDDPFLMEALEGFESRGSDQQPNVGQLKERLAQYGAPSTKRVMPLWRALTIAASLLIAISAGILILRPKPQEHDLAKATNMILPERTTHTQTDKTMIAGNQIAGTVTDATGHGLSGVKVKVAGTRIIAKTDSAGRFSLPKVTQGTLNIAAAGYDAKHIKLDGGSQLNVVLNESANSLASVQVTAYVEDDKPANKTHPTIGWKAFRDYLRKNAFTDDGETGVVKLAFNVDTLGTINNIHILKGKNEAMNQKAIALILHGPDWKGITKGETRLKILFRKGKG